MPPTTPPNVPPQTPPLTSPQDVLASAGLDSKTVQVLMAMMREQQKNFLEGIAELRKPTAEEAEKSEKVKERLLQARKNAAAQGAAVEAQIRSEQSRCQHMKPDGQHTFRGQVHSDNWAEVKCVRCLIRFRVKPLPQMIASGMNLDQMPGLTIEHLKSWAKQSARIERELSAVATRQARLNEIKLDPAHAGEAITGL